MTEIFKYLLIPIIYLIYLFIWLVINLVIYFFSVATNNSKPIVFLIGITAIVIYLLNLILGIGLFWIGVSLLLDRQFFWFILYFLFGAGSISYLFNIIQIPFLGIPGYFCGKIEKELNEEDIETAEVIDKSGNVIDKIEGDRVVSKRLAKYFLAFYSLILFSLFIFPVEREGLGILGFIIKPLTQMIGGTIIVGIPYCIYRKLKYKVFFTKDNRYFFVQVWKLCLYIFVPYLILLYVFAFLTGTL